MKRPERRRDRRKGAASGRQAVHARARIELKSGDVVLIRLPSSEGGPAKLRPALVLALLPGAFQNVLICGISSRLQGLEPGWDEVIGAKDKDFAASGLHRASSIRLSYLYAAEAQEIAGVIGSIDRSRLERLLARLASRLKS